MYARRSTEPRAPVQHTAYCDRCRRSFVHDRALEQHTGASPRHNVCSGCDFDYITREEMEECDCNESEEEEEEQSDEYGSADTLSDDGGGGRDIIQNGPGIMGSYNTYYAAPGAWSSGTRTSESESSFPEYDPNEFWQEAIDAGLPEDYDDDYSESHSEGSYSHSNDVTEDEDEPPATNAEPTPYCQRCNRQFNTPNALHQHNRTSSRHPWYCIPCKVDYDRESDLERHNAAVHAEGNQPAGRQQFTTGLTDSSNRTVINLLGQLNTHLGRMLDTSVTAEADMSASTIRTTGVIPAPESPPRIPSIAQPLRVEEGSSMTITSVESSGRPKLVVTCPLCLEDAMGLTSTLCGHVFCKECITAAIQHKSECPVCRAITHINSLHPIFLNVIS